MSGAHATLSELVADSLRDSIRAGQYACGERLIELAIAQSQNVSQNTVRDALRQLETEGWVRYEPRRGVRVRRFGPAEAEEIFALTATLEQLALGWAFEELSRADLKALLAPPVIRARQEHSVGQVARRRSALFAFHEALAALTEHPQTRTLLATLRNQAVLLTADYESRARDYSHHYDQMDDYENFVAMLKSATPAEMQAALYARVLADGKPIVRWLALNT